MGDIIIVNGTINKENDEENSIVKLYYNSSEKIDSKIFSSGKAMVFSINKNLSAITVDKLYDITAAFSNAPNKETPKETDVELLAKYGVLEF